VYVVEVMQVFGRVRSFVVPRNLGQRVLQERLLLGMPALQAAKGGPGNGRKESRHPEQSEPLDLRFPGWLQPIKVAECGPYSTASAILEAQQTKGQERGPSGQPNDFTKRTH